MTQSRNYLDLALASIQVFTDDGRMDAGELDKLLALALCDGVVDDDERRVLANIFRRAEEAGVSAEVAARIGQARRLHGIPG